MTSRTQLWHFIRKLSDPFRGSLSAGFLLFGPKPILPETFGIMTREVYNLIAEMDDVRMITPPNPPHLPIATFEFEHASYKFEVQLQSLNGIQGVDPGNQYDTSVSTILALSRWLIPDATAEELNTFNVKYLNCRAVKVGDFVEIAIVSRLILLRGHERPTIEDMIGYLVLDSKDFIQDLVSSR